MELAILQQERGRNSQDQGSPGAGQSVALLGQEVTRLRLATKPLADSGVTLADGGKMNRSPAV